VVADRNAASLVCEDDTMAESDPIADDVIDSAAIVASALQSKFGYGTCKAAINQIAVAPAETAPIWIDVLALLRSSNDQLSPLPGDSKPSLIIATAISSLPS
jgi:hypothetical protein